MGHDSTRRRITRETISSAKIEAKIEQKKPTKFAVLRFLTNLKFYNAVTYSVYNQQTCHTYLV